MAAEIPNKIDTGKTPASNSFDVDETKEIRMRRQQVWLHPS